MDNFIKFQSNEIKTLAVKIPHLSKKINIKYFPYETAGDLISKIEDSIDHSDVNYGLLVKTINGYDAFLNENKAMSEQNFVDSKVSFVKKCRTMFYENLDTKKVKLLNSKEYQTLFLRLMIKNDFKAIMHMLKEGFDPNFLTNGEPLLFHSISNENAASLITSILVSYNAHPDLLSITRQSAIHKAVRVSKPDIIKFFIQLGVSVNSCDNKGLTPLYYSIIYPAEPTCLAILISAGAKIGCSNFEGLKEIHQASFLGKMEHLRILICNAHANVDEPVVINDSLYPSSETTQLGYTPLHFAVIGQQWHIVKYLITIAHANITAINDLQQTPLDLYNDIVDKLSNLDQDSDDNFEIIRQLLTHGKVVHNVMTSDDCSIKSSDTEVSNQSNKCNIEVGQPTADCDIMKAGETAFPSGDCMDKAPLTKECDEDHHSVSSINTSSTDHQPEHESNDKHPHKSTVDNQLDTLQKSSFNSNNDEEWVSKKSYFGLESKLIEFKRMPEFNNGFGFSLESDSNGISHSGSGDMCTDYDGFRPTIQQPSLHRICQYRVLSAVMDLHTKPFLLEVNGNNVTTMPHFQLSNLIRSVPDKIELRITNINEYKTSEESQNNAIININCSDYSSKISSLIPNSQDEYTKPSKCDYKRSSFELKLNSTYFHNSFNRAKLPIVTQMPNGNSVNTSQCYINKDYSSKKSDSNYETQPNFMPNCSPRSTKPDHISTYEPIENRSFNYHSIEHNTLIEKTNNQISTYNLSSKPVTSNQYINCLSSNIDRQYYDQMMNNFSDEECNQIIEPEKPMLHRTGLILKLKRMPTLSNQQFYVDNPDNSPNSSPILMNHSSNINIPPIN